MGIDIEPPMPPKRFIGETDSKKKEKKGFFSRFKKTKPDLDLSTPSDSSVPVSSKNEELRKKLGLDSSSSISVKDLHEQLQQDADDFADDLAKQYDAEQSMKKKESEVVADIPASISDDILDSEPQTSSKTVSSSPDEMFDSYKESVSSDYVDADKSLKDDSNPSLVPKDIAPSSDSKVPEFLLSEEKKEKNSKSKSSKTPEITSWTNDDFDNTSYSSKQSSWSSDEEITSSKTSKSSSWSHDVSIDDIKSKEDNLELKFDKPEEITKTEKSSKNKEEDVSKPIVEAKIVDELPVTKESLHKEINSQPLDNKEIKEELEKTQVESNELEKEKVNAIKEEIVEPKEDENLDIDSDLEPLPDDFADNVKPVENLELPNFDESSKDVSSSDNLDDSDLEPLPDDFASDVMSTENIENPAPAISDNKSVPTLTTFDKPEHKGFLSKLFGKKKHSKVSDVAPINDISPIPPISEVEEPSLKDASDLYTFKITADDGFSIESDDPFSETESIKDHRASTLKKLIDSGHVGVEVVKGKKATKKISDNSDIPNNDEQENYEEHKFDIKEKVKPEYCESEKLIEDKPKEKKLLKKETKKSPAKKTVKKATKKPVKKEIKKTKKSTKKEIVKKEVKKSPDKKKETPKKKEVSKKKEKVAVKGKKTSPKKSKKSKTQTIINVTPEFCENEKLIEDKSEVLKEKNEVEEEIENIVKAKPNTDSHINSFAQEIDKLVNASKNALELKNSNLAKNKYNEAKNLFANSKLNTFHKKRLYKTLKELYDSISLSILEEEAQKQIADLV